MRAWIQKRYGGPDVLEQAELPRSGPKDDEVLVRVVASTVSSGDARIRAFDVPGMVWVPARLALGITRPRNPVRGSDFAGEVVELGRAVTRWKLGDRVFGLTVSGSHAEFKRVKASAAMTLIPEGLSFEAAAALPFAAMSASRPTIVRRTWSASRTGRGWSNSHALPCGRGRQVQAGRCRNAPCR